MNDRIERVTSSTYFLSKREQHLRSVKKNNLIWFAYKIRKKR